MKPSGNPISLIVVGTLAFVVCAMVVGAIIGGLKGQLRPEASYAMISAFGTIIGAFIMIMKDALGKIADNAPKDIGDGETNSKG